MAQFCSCPSVFHLRLFGKRMTVFGPCLLTYMERSLKMPVVKVVRNILVVSFLGEGRGGENCLRGIFQSGFLGRIARGINPREDEGETKEEQEVADALDPISAPVAMRSAQNMAGPCLRMRWPRWWAPSRRCRCRFLAIWRWASTCSLSWYGAARVRVVECALVRRDPESFFNCTSDFPCVCIVTRKFPLSTSCSRIRSFQGTA